MNEDTSPDRPPAGPGPAEPAAAGRAAEAARAGEAARTAAERAARLSYGRLLAHLARAWRDLSAAEDALAEAFRAALETWPRDGVPASPDAWLLTAARNRLTDLARSRKLGADAWPTLALLAEVEAPVPDPVPDRRLALLFVCAHPEIEPSARTPLMLQTVLGLDAARIASAFLVAPATMGQRLVRAKARIREAGLRFELPAREDLPARTESVREAIYAAYGKGWDDVASADPAVKGLAPEAIWLARLLAELVPDDAEAHGLLALLLHCEARRSARRTAGGAFVPLSRQDVALWDRPMIEEAEGELRRAARLGHPGRFQIEAAIQSAHMEATVGGRDLSRPLAALHAALLGFAPTIGNRLGHAAAIAGIAGPEAGLALLADLPEPRIRDHQPYWALRGHLLSRAGRSAEARQALARAAGLADDPAIKAHLTSEAAAPASDPCDALARE